VLLDSMGIGLIIPVLPKLLEGFLGGDVSEASRIGGYLFAAYALMLFLFSPLLGALSDRFGRRPILLASIFGQGLDYLLLAFAGNLWLFAAGRLIAGALGASFTTANAYIADVTTEENRAQGFGMVMAGFGVGFILGPAIGGLVGQLGPEWPFIVASILSMLNWLYGMFLLPESLPKEKRTKFDIWKANPFGALAHLRKFPAVVGLIVVFFLLSLSGDVMPAVWVFFTEYTFGWVEWENGLSLTYVGLLIAVVQIALTKVLVKKLGERVSALVGLGLMAVSLACIGFANQGWMMYAFTLPYVIGGFGMPAIQAMMTKHVSASEQGHLQGTITSMQSIAAFAAPLLYTTLFATYTSSASATTFPGVPFWVAGGIMGIAFVIALVAIPKRKPLQPDPPQPDVLQSEPELDDVATVG
jgi:MFS transporter, DHA1 family, tetracycline resistance protein